MADSVVTMLDRLHAQIGAPDQVTARATLLVATAHHTRDRDVWGGDRAITYWDRLPDRVRTGCYRGPLLAHWWESMCRTLGSGQPTVIEDRVALAQALAAGSDAAVLTELRTQTEALCLRVRLAVQLSREAAPTKRASAEPAATEPAISTQGALL